jgi:anti-anti-sigma factor
MLKDQMLDRPSDELAPPQLSCTCSATDEGTVLALRGEIDIASAHLLDAWLDAARELDQRIIVDLEGVTFLDSSGLHALLRAREEGPLELRSARPIVARCLELTGVDRLLSPAPGVSAGERWQP